MRRGIDVFAEIPFLPDADISNHACDPQIEDIIREKHNIAEIFSGRFTEVRINCQNSLISR